MSASLRMRRSASKRLTDRNTSRRGVRGPVVCAGRHNRADDDERAEAADGSGEEELAASEAVEEEDGRERRDHVADAVDARGEERRGVRVEAERREDGRGVVWERGRVRRSVSSFEGMMGRRTYR